MLGDEGEKTGIRWEKMYSKLENTNYEIRGQGRERHVNHMKDKAGRMIPPYKCSLKHDMGALAKTKVGTKQKDCYGKVHPLRGYKIEKHEADLVVGNEKPVADKEQSTDDEKEADNSQPNNTDRNMSFKLAQIIPSMVKDK